MCATTIRPSLTVTILTCDAYARTTAWKFVMPRLMDVAKEHFGCPSMNGVELDNDHGSCS